MGLWRYRLTMSGFMVVSSLPDQKSSSKAFAIDVLACPHCGGRLRLIATLHDPAVIRTLLAHLGMARSGPSPGPAPPES